METIINFKNVSRDYTSILGSIKRSKKTVNAVKELSLTINKGEIFGILGPNGAGKTTLIKMMTTLLVPSKGKLTIMDKDVAKDSKYIRQHINFVFGGERNLYWRLSAFDNLAFFADIYRIPRNEQKGLIDDLLKKVGLYDKKDHKVETFSKGMKQRLQIAKALINNPKILFLDEPTIGLDPIGAKMLRQIIKEVASKKTTVILTTHYMPEAEDLCDRIAIINHGQVIALNDFKGLQENYGSINQNLEDLYIQLVGG